MQPGGVTMRDLTKVLDQKLDSREFQEAWEASSMEYDFIDRIATVCAKLAHNAADKNN